MQTAGIVPVRLSELNGKIANAIRGSFADISFWVIADITNHSFKPLKNYHNFELAEKDPDSNDIIAKISGKAWGKGSQRIVHFENLTGQKFTNNIHVLVNVSVDFHSVYGLQVTVNDIDTSFTMGVLEQQRQETLNRLVTENPAYIQRSDDRYITRNSQLLLPDVIQKIAVLSSTNSAGGEDFKHTLLNNSYGYHFEIDFYFTEVQGEANADQFLKKIIEVFNSKKPYDALVITRGGGAQTDFLIFDNYYIGRAVARFPIPVITGIGHQKNETITDLMVHTQTKTPTRAAEFIIAHNRLFEERILSLQKVMVIRTQQLFSRNFQSLSLHSSIIVNNSRTVISNCQDKLIRLQQAAMHGSKTLLLKSNLDIQHISGQLVSKPKMVLNNLRKDISSIRSNLNTFQSQYLKNKKGYLEHHISLIRMMAPDNILKKGFAIVKWKNQILSDPGKIKAGDEIDVILSDIQIKTTVLKKSKYNGTDFNL